MRSIHVLLAVLLVGCLPQGYSSATYTGYTVSSGTGVYVNGQELTADDKAQLDALVDGVVPPGRYTIDAAGNAGPEGQPPVVNLVERARARQQPQATHATRPTSMYSTDSAGRGSSIVHDGGCTILSTPDGSLSSGC